MPSHDLRHLPAGLPWHVPAYLLLDGVSASKLPQRIYQWSESPDFDVLYLNTPLAELSDLSPCLIRLGGPEDPVLAAFLENSQEEWGYLLLSGESRAELLSHLRWLVRVRHPMGEEVLLRLADPAVLHGLLEHLERDDTTLFGPIEQVVLADRIEGRWHQHQRPGPAQVARHDRPYQLSEAQLKVLGEVGFRGVVARLDEHLHEYFPGYQNGLNRPERRKHVQVLAEQAYAQGFQSEQDITLYANIFGLLGQDALQTHTDIAALLSHSSALTPSQRIEQAADLAYARAQPVERTSL